MSAFGIHPTAWISPKAILGRDVAIGPFCVIEDDAIVGDRCHLAARVVVKSGTTLGTDNEVAEGAVLGGRPQHLRAGEDIGDARIGCGNFIREYVTVHRALRPGTSTTIGDHNMIMVNAHVAHDCVIGDHTILANNVMLAGHVTVANRAYLSGAVGVHQFCRIGQYAMVGGQAHINRDVPPYITVDGLASLVVGLNVVGLRRGGFSDEDLRQLKAAYRLLYRSGLTWQETLAALREEFPSGPAAAMHEFLAGGKRGFVQERRTPRLATLRMPQAVPGDGVVPELRRFG